MKIGKTNLGWGEYFRATPKNVQRIGDALTGFSLFMTGYAVIMEAKCLAIAFIIIGGLGTFMQRLVGEE